MKPPEVSDNHPRTVRRLRSKRAAEDSVALVQRLVDLPPELLDDVGLDADLRDLLEQLRPMGPNSARRRLHRYIAGRLRGEDTSPISAQLDVLEDTDRDDVIAHHAVERWRDRLLSDGDPAIDALLEAHPTADRKRVRQLVRQAHKERAQQKPPRAARALFRLLRELPP